MSEEKTLGKVLKGRTIQSTQNKNGEMILGFSDDSTMTVQTGSGSSNSAATGGTIREIHRSETSLHLELVNGRSLLIPLAGEKTSGSVVVRDKEGGTEYED